MTTMYIELRSIDAVKSFVNDITKMEGEFDLISGRYVIDAKSIMGIFSLDLAKSLQLQMDGVTEGDLEVIRKYEVQNS